jgi:hypothetical protein
MKIKYVICVLFTLQYVLLKAQLTPSFVRDTGEDIKHFYIGLDNYIKIKLNNADGSLVNVKSTAVSYISKHNDSTYSVRFDAQLDQGKLKLYYKNLPLDIMIFDFINIPSPKITLDGHVQNISKSKLQSLKKFTLEYPENLLKNLNLKFFSCSVKIQIPNKPLMAFDHRSLDLVSNIVNLIPQFNVGTTITFDDILLLNNFNQIVNTKKEAIIFKVVEN